MHKKSQAALEFLTTYAWAFLVIIIMISALAYFGILNPSKLLPTRCNFAAEFGCEDYVIMYGNGLNDGAFYLKLKNNIGEPIVVDDLNLTTEDGTDIDALCTGTDPSVPSWGSGVIETLDWSSCNLGPTGAGFTQGDKGKLLVEIKYHLSKSDSSYQRIAEGEVYTSVI